MKTIVPLTVVASVILSSSAFSLRAENPVIVHEWGTFTSLQDENGNEIGGINVDDEPVPNFVYTVGAHPVTALNHNPWTFGLPPYSSFVGKAGTSAPVGDPEVTMRLETPVLYIYPPKGESASSVPPLDVHVDFHGGVLSQYYPYATVLGAAADTNGPVDLSDHTMSGLYWSNVRLGSTGKPVETDDKVWTTPRETSAPELEVKASVFDSNANESVETKQSEHFLFYRGVGHLESPLKTDSTLRLYPNASASNGPDHLNLWASPVDMPANSAAFSDSWLVQIREDGACAFIHSDLADNKARRGWFLSGPDGSGKTGHFDPGNLATLKTSMQDALVKEGLYPDEASAMLRTWELSYFKSPGLRFFYIVPRQWVDKTLPLTITGAPVKITRVMVGRIELVSDEQKFALARLAREPYADLNSLKNEANQTIVSGHFSKQEQADFESGARPLTDLGITLSDSVRDYLSLGRFRDALIVHEQQEHPSDNFARFIKENGLATAQ